MTQPQSDGRRQDPVPPVPHSGAPAELSPARLRRQNSQAAIGGKAAVRTSPAAAAPLNGLSPSMSPCPQPPPGALGPAYHPQQHQQPPYPSPMLSPQQHPSPNYHANGSYGYSSPNGRQNFYGRQGVSAPHHVQPLPQQQQQQQQQRSPAPGPGMQWSPHGPPPGYGGQPHPMMPAGYGGHPMASMQMLGLPPHAQYNVPPPQMGHPPYMNPHLYPPHQQLHGYQTPSPVLQAVQPPQGDAAPQGHAGGPPSRRLPPSRAAGPSHQGGGVAPGPPARSPSPTASPGNGAPAPLRRRASFLQGQTTSFNQPAPPHNPVPQAVEGGEGSPIVPLVRTTSILQRESSFKKQKANASAFPATQSSSGAGPAPVAVPSAAAAGGGGGEPPILVPPVAPAGILQRESSFKKQKPNASAFPPSTANTAVAVGTASASSPTSASSDASSPDEPPPAVPLVRAASILNRRSSFRNAKIETAEDTKQRLRAELEAKQAQRQREFEMARAEQQLRNAAIRQAKEDRLRQVLEKQQQRLDTVGDRGAPPQTYSASEDMPCQTSIVPARAARPAAIHSEEVRAPPKRQLSDRSIVSSSSAAADRLQRGAPGARSSLMSIHDAADTSASSGRSKDHSTPRSGDLSVASGGSASLGATSSGKASSPRTPAPPLVAMKRVSPPAAAPPLQRAPTLVLYEVPLRRARNSGSSSEEGNPVKTYGDDCNDIRVTVDEDAETVNFLVDELFAHRKSSTYFDSKLLTKVSETVFSGRNASVFSMDANRLVPALSSSPMETPTWCAHQWLVSDLAKKLFAARQVQLEEDFTEVAVSIAAVRQQQGVSAAVVDDLLADSAIARSIKLSFDESPFLGKTLHGVSYVTLSDEGDFAGLFARAQNNAGRVVANIERTAKNAAAALESLVFVVTCVATRRTPGALPNLSGVGTWSDAGAADGLAGGFMEESDVEDAESAVFLSRAPRDTHALREGEGDLVRSCLTIVAVDDRHPIALSAAAAAKGKMQTGSRMDPALRSWMKDLLVGRSFNAVVASISPAHADAADVLAAQRTVAAVGHRPARYRSCRRLLAVELARKRAGGPEPLDVEAFTKEVEASCVLSGDRFLVSS